MTRTIRRSLASAVALLVALLGLAQVSAGPLTSPETDFTVKYEATLKAVPSYELPAKSASLVALAKPDQKEAAALAVIKIVSKLNPAAMTTVVGAISQGNPTLATKLSAEAAKLQPKLTSEIKLATTAVSTTTGTSTGTSTPLASTSVSTSSDPIASPPTDPGSSGNGKKKGHYKNGVP